MSSCLKNLRRQKLRMNSHLNSKGFELISKPNYQFQLIVNHNDHRGMRRLKESNLQRKMKDVVASYLTSFQTLLYKNRGTTRVALSNLAIATALQTCLESS